jgi:hypothetical protein
MLFPLVLLLSIQTVVGVRWDKMGPTGPYFHKSEDDAIRGLTPIAQPCHPSFTTPALATVRELWEVSTAFPFFWFPVHIAEVIGTPGVLPLLEAFLFRLEHHTISMQPVLDARRQVRFEV